MTIQEPVDPDWLHARWQALMDVLQAERTMAEVTWYALVQHYSEPHRAYHTLAHIQTLLRHADAEKMHIHRMELIELAIWFHDAIYDPHAADNELRSAAWAREALQAIGIDAALIPQVEQCILATQGHQLNASHIPDLPLFLDLDLAILGASEDAYRRYSQMIRVEYRWMTDAAYRAGRAEVLRRFAQRTTLFHVPEIAEQLEEQARRNIAEELQELTSNSTQ